MYFKTFTQGFSKLVPGLFRLGSQIIGIELLERRKFGDQGIKVQESKNYNLVFIRRISRNFGSKLWLSRDRKIDGTGLLPCLCVVCVNCRETCCSVLCMLLVSEVVICCCCCCCCCRYCCCCCRLMAIKWRSPRSGGKSHW